MEWGILVDVSWGPQGGGQVFDAVLSGDAQATLALLGKSGIANDAYLAGGSALALYYGHRYSVDFNLFSSVPFDPKQLSKTLSSLGPFVEEVAKGVSLIGTFRGTKMSYFHYRYPLVKPTTRYRNVNVAHPHDIAAMKLVAITDRGTKKDFVDLYTLTQRGVSLENMFQFYDKKYGLFDANRYTLIKALSYLDEANEDKMPQMIASISWDEVKRFFTAESMRLAKHYLEEAP